MIICLDVRNIRRKKWYAVILELKNAGQDGTFIELTLKITFARHADFAFVSTF